MDTVSVRGASGQLARSKIADGSRREVPAVRRNSVNAKQIGNTSIVVSDDPSFVADGPAIFTTDKVLRTLSLPFPGNYSQLNTRLERDNATLWCEMQPHGPQSFTPGLLHDLNQLQRAIRKDSLDSADSGLDYYVLCSASPGIFNLGGDLGLFEQAIVKRDRNALVRYAHDCINVLYTNYLSFGRRTITIGLVEGDALGGGFEAALSCDVLIAEAGTKFGLPEVLFNLFPGMGAFSILGRQLGQTAAREIIQSGRIYQAEELRQRGLVHMVVPQGEGRQAVRQYIARNQGRHNAHYGMYESARRVAPLEFSELVSVIDVWVDSALCLSSRDLRRMRRIMKAQSTYHTT